MAGSIKINFGGKSKKAYELLEKTTVEAANIISSEVCPEDRCLVGLIPNAICIKSNSTVKGKCRTDVEASLGIGKEGRR